jgi:hypothetical protein
MDETYDAVVSEMSNTQGFVASLFAGWNHGAAMF